jgi:hypothetical protein
MHEVRSFTFVTEKVKKKGKKIIAESFFCKFLLSLSQRR